MKRIKESKTKINAYEKGIINITMRKQAMSEPCNIAKRQTRVIKY